MRRLRDTTHRNRRKLIPHDSRRAPDRVAYNPPEPKAVLRAREASSAAARVDAGAAES